MAQNSTPRRRSRKVKSVRSATSFQGRPRQDAGCEGEFRYQGGRSWLRCRLLQVDRPEAEDLAGWQPMSPSLDNDPARLRLGGASSIDATVLIETVTFKDGRRRAFPGRPPTSAKLIATETERWAKVVKFSGARRTN